MDNTRRKSTLFLTEQLIVIAVFALCAVACISILTTSYFMARDSRATSYALIAVQNYAEVFKATGGDIEATADVFKSRKHVIFDNDGDDFTFSISMDENWVERPVPSDSAAFVLTLSGSTVRYENGVSLIVGDVSVSRGSGEVLVSLPLAVRGIEN